MRDVSPGAGLPLFEVDLAPAAAGTGRPETLVARYVVWAAGEFQYPRASPPAAGGAGGDEEKKSEEGSGGPGGAAGAAEGEKGLVGAELW